MSITEKDTTGETVSLTRGESKYQKALPKQTQTTHPGSELDALERVETVAPPPSPNSWQEPNEPLCPAVPTGVEVLPGIVVAEYVKCGKAWCRCASGLPGTLHGPYHYRYFRVKGRLCKRYVRKAEVEAVKAGCALWRQVQAWLRWNRRANDRLFGYMGKYLRWVRSLPFEYRATLLGNISTRSQPWRAIPA